MSDDVPTESDLRQAYVEAAGATMPQESYYAEQVAEFECGIARIKAEAWDEGYAAGQADDEFEATNPYREGGGTVNWDAQSDRAAIRYYSDWCPDGIQEAHRRGARWQREALLADDVIERAAETMFAYSFSLPGEGMKRWGSAASEVKQMHRIKARAALMAAIEGDEW